MHEIYTIKYSHIYIFSLIFMLFYASNNSCTYKVGLGQLTQANLHLARREFERRAKIKE